MVYGQLVPWTSDASWIPSVTILIVLYFAILALWNFYTGLFFIFLLSWVNNFIHKISVEPRSHPIDAVKECLSLYNCLQDGMSTFFYAFFTTSQSNLIFVGLHGN